MSAADTLKRWYQHAGLLMATTAGASVPLIMQATENGLTLGEGITAATLGASATVSGVVGGKLGNSLHDFWTARQVDPESLLANHDLQILTGQACQLAIARAADELELMSEDRDRFRNLADAFAGEWSNLAGTPGFSQSVLKLSKDDLKHWFHAGSDADPESPQPAMALDVEKWGVLIRVVAKKHECTPAETAIKELSEYLTNTLPYVVRELLKNDFAKSTEDGGFAFAGYVVKMLSEVLAAANSGQFERGVLLENTESCRSELSALATDMKTVVDNIEYATDRTQFEAFRDFENQYELWARIDDGFSQVENHLNSIDSSVGGGFTNTLTMLDLIHEANQGVARTILSSIEDLGLGLHQVLRAQSPVLASTPDNMPLEPLRVGAIKRFVARPELTKIKRWLLNDNSTAIVYVHGMAGVGKSYLVERFLEKFWRPTFESPQIAWLMLRPDGQGEYPEPAELLAQICAQFGINALSIQLQVQQLHRALAHRTGRLLIIENVDDAEAAKRASELLHRLDGGNVMVTGRLGDFGSQWQRVKLEPFDPNNGKKQLKAELGSRLYSQLEATEVERLMVDLGGLPLAIHLAAGHLQIGTKVDEYLEQLRITGLSLEPAQSDNPRLILDPNRAILQSSFTLSWNAFIQMSKTNAESWQQALAAIGNGPLSGFGVGIGSAYAGLQAPELCSLCRLANRLSIITEVERPEASQRTWRVHPLLAEFLSAKSDKRWIDRITNWFVDRFPESDHPELGRVGWHEINAEFDALIEWLPAIPSQEIPRVERAARDYAISNGPFPLWVSLCERGLASNSNAEDGSNLLWTLSNVAYHAGDYERAIQASQAKFDIDKELDNPREVALAMGQIADVLYQKGELDEALRIRREEQLPVYEKLGDVRSRAVTMGQIADVLYQKGELDEALRIRREEELPVYEKLGDVRSRAVTMGKIADVLYQKGELDEALRIRREEELPVYEKLGDVRSRAVTMGKIADVLYQKGELDEALRIRREEELPVYEKLGDVRSRAVTMGQIADVLYQKGELDEALRIRREEQLPVYEKLGDVRSRAVTMGQIADVLYQKGELDEALRIRREEQLPVYEKLGDVRSRAVTMGKIADVLYQKGELDEALRIRREEQLPVYEKLGDVRSRAVTMGQIADVLYQKGELDEALRIRREEQLPVYEKLGDVRSRAVTMGQIADVLYQKGELDEALRIRREEELPVYEKLGDVRSRAVTMGQIADVLYQKGELDEALRIRREEQLPVYEKLGDVRSRAVTMGKIADVLYQKGELDEALRIRREEELPVYEKLGDVRSRAVTMGKIADVLYQKGELDEALRIRREEQLPVYEKLGDVRSRAVTMGQIADVLYQKGELDEALRIRREEELPVYEKLGDVRSRAVTMGKIADVLYQKGELDEALRIRREEELPVYEKLGDVRSRAVTMGKIADVLYQKGELDEALRIRREEELPVYEKLGDVRSRAVTMGQIADVLYQKGELDEALRIRREEQLPVYEKLGDVRSLVISKVKIGIQLAESGKQDEGKQYIEWSLEQAERIGIHEIEQIRQILASFG